MMHRISLVTMTAVAVLAMAMPQLAQAQSTVPSKPVGCNLAWCPIQVEVIKNSSGAEALKVSFDEIRMAPKYSGATITWKLMGSPDYEFRADSVTAKGANAPWAVTQFPLRLVSANEYAYDDLNNSGMTYGYEVRVYKKGSPAGSTPLVSTGTVVNAN